MRFLLVGIRGSRAMTAEIIPFPRARNRRHINGMVRRLITMKPANVEGYIKARLDEAHKRMLSRGVRPEVAHREISQHEAAIRAELWDVVLNLGGAA